jgi:hypothetical protein
MPAYRQRVYLCPDQGGQPVRVLDFPLWWDRRQFFKKFGDRQIDSGNPTYVDYGLLLARSEAQAWDRHCRQTFARDPRREQVVVIEEMHLWETLLKDSRWLIVESYEWESGLE